MQKIHPENSLDSIVQADLKIKSITHCNKIIISQNKTCRCGKNVEEHSPEQIEKFREDLNLKKIETWSSRAVLAIGQHKYDVFGEIQFQGASDNLAKFVKVPNLITPESMDSIMDILFGNEYWNMRMPELLISVTGGANLSSLSHKLKETFGKALVKVATNTNALITSGGSYNGCMRVVGEAFKKNALSVDPSKIINLIGIANWDTIYNKAYLLNQQTQRKKQSTFVAEYELVKPKGNKDILLDPNHSHFLLVETRSALGAEVPYRASLERCISNNLKIPIIVLVVGGGFRTAESIAQAVQLKTPCVFLESSGEVADIFAFAVNRIDKVREKNKDKIDFNLSSFLQDPQFKEDIISKIRCYFKESEKIDSIIKSIEQAVLKNEENFKFLNVCRPVNERADIDVAILQALLKIHSTTTEEKNSSEAQRNLQTQLKLSLSWDRVDIARKFIFTTKNIEKMGSLDEAMIIALTKNRLDFVKLFIENGFSIKNFLTNNILIKLYNQTPKDTPINRYIRLQSRRNHRRISFKLIGSAIESLLEHFYNHRFTTAHLSLSSYELEQLISGSSEMKDKNILNAFGSSEASDTLPASIYEKCEFPEHELFIFSILSGWDEMAKLFCKDGRNALIHILIASKIFKSFSQFFEDEEVFFTQKAKNLENLACNILQVCYENDSNNAEITLTRKVPEFDNSTCIQAAVLAKDLDFISHPCFQTVLTRIWYNEIDPDISKIKLGLYVLFPLISPYYFWSRGRKQTHSIQNVDDEESLYQSDEKTCESK